MHPNTVKRVKSLTKYTSRGLPHLCRGLVDLAKHLISKKTVFVCHVGVTYLVGKQFGKLRQGWYLFHHSAFSSIAKTKLLLNLAVNVDGFSVQSCDKCGYLLDEDKCHIYYGSYLYCWLCRYK